MAYITRQTTREGTLVTPAEAKARRETAEARAQGWLRCVACGSSFDPSSSAINGVSVGPSAHCNRCQQGNFDAGRWQERLRFECATEKP